MAGGWLFVAGVCWLANSVRPDFGPPEGVPDAWQVELNANQLRDTFVEALVPLRRIPTEITLEDTQELAELVTFMVRNVSEVGRQFASNFSRAALEKKSSLDLVFGELRATTQEMRNVLANTSEVIELQLVSRIKSVKEYELAIEGLVNATEQCFEVMSLLEENLLNMSSTAITGDLARKLGFALSVLKEKVRVFIREVDTRINSIQLANTLCNNIHSMLNTTSSRFEESLRFLQDGIRNENASTISRYNRAAENARNDLARAVKRLDLFASNEMLLKHTDAHKEIFTSTYYELYNRNGQDVSKINSSFLNIASNTSTFLETTNSKFTSAVRTAALSLTKMILTRGACANPCYDRLTPQVTGSFEALQRRVQNCMARDRERLPRIPDAVDRVLQLLQVTSADLASDIGTCSGYGQFNSNSLEYSKARACLETSIEEFGRFSEVIDSILQSFHRNIQAEVEASVFRINLCVKQPTRELTSMLETIPDLVGSCTGNCT